MSTTVGTYGNPCQFLLVLAGTHESPRKSMATRGSHHGNLPEPMGIRGFCQGDPLLLPSSEEPTETLGNPREPLRTHRNPWEPMTAAKVSCICQALPLIHVCFHGIGHGLPRILMGTHGKSHRIHRNPVGIYSNPWQSLWGAVSSHRNPWESTRTHGNSSQSPREPTGARESLSLLTRVPVAIAIAKGTRGSAWESMTAAKIFMQLDFCRRLWGLPRITSGSCQIPWVPMGTHVNFDRLS